MSQIHLETLDAILEKHQCDPSQVIAIMQDIQKEYHYLPESALCYTARKLGISDAKIYGVATFYENFSLEPKGICNKGLRRDCLPCAEICSHPGGDPQAA